MTRLPILTLCLVLSGTLAAQSQPLDRRSAQAQYATGGSQNILRDQAANDLQGEWWQLTASLTDRDGRPWALEWTLHRRQSGARGAGNRHPADILSLAHVSITTPDGIYHEQNFESRDAVIDGVAGMSENAGQAGWEWVSQGEALLPARLSFSVGERDVNLLLEASGIADLPASTAAEPAASLPSVRVRGFVDRGASKTYLRGIGRLDREWYTPALTGKPGDANQPATRKISSTSE